MPAATGFGRAAVKQRLRDILENSPDLAGIAVSYSPPRDTDLTSEGIWFGDVRGEMTVPNMRAASLANDDRFTVDLIATAWGAGDSDHEQVDENVEAVAEVLRAILAARPFLDDDGGAPLPGVVSAVVAQCDGPFPWWRPEGLGAAMRLTVAVHMRIT